MRPSDVPDLFAVPKWVTWARVLPRPWSFSTPMKLLKPLRAHLRQVYSACKCPLVLDLSVDPRGGLSLQSGEQRFYEHIIGFRFPMFFSGSPTSANGTTTPPTVSGSTSTFTPSFGARSSVTKAHSRSNGKPSRKTRSRLTPNPSAKKNVNDDRATAKLTPGGRSDHRYACKAPSTPPPAPPPPP